MTLDRLLVDAARAGLSFQRDNGSMPAGHNGPWNVPETPVRATAHWAMTFYKGFELSNDEELLTASTKSCEYLLGIEAIPNGCIYHCLSDSKKPKSNMLIGQAWAVEPLLVLGSAMNRENYLAAAVKVLGHHPYSSNLHGWFNMEIDRRVLSFNRTVNQQVWFAAMALLAGKYDDRLNQQARDFYSHFFETITFSEPGLILHRHHPSLFKKYAHLAASKKWIALLKGTLNEKLRTAELYELSIGYQPFLLYGLAIAAENSQGMLANLAGDNKILMKKCIDYVLSRFPYHRTGGNAYAWSYNPTGIEMAYVLQVFGHQFEIDNYRSLAQEWLTIQFEDHFDAHTARMDRSTSDSKTLSARIYEATRLHNLNSGIA